MNLPDFLRSDEHGEVFLAGHRVTLYHVLANYRECSSVDAVAAAFPSVPPELLQKVLAYYRQHQDEVDQYVEETLGRHNHRGTFPLDVDRLGDPADLALGATDAQVLAWAEHGRRILVSGYRKTLLNHFAAHLAAGRHSPGLFLLRPSASLPDIVDFFVAAA
jgi:uncharacterized protein (DUF433 family)